MALQHLFGRAGADAQDVARRQGPPDRRPASDALQEDVVGGVVAVRQGQDQQAVDGSLIALVGEQLLDRLVEHAHVGAGDQHRVVEPQPPPLDRVEHRQSNPQLGDALLRIEPLGVAPHGPARAHLLDGDPDRAVEAGRKGVDGLLEPRRTRRRWRWRLWHDGAGRQDQERGEREVGEGPSHDPRTPTAWSAVNGQCLTPRVSVRIGSG